MHNNKTMNDMPRPTLDAPGRANRGQAPAFRGWTPLHFPRAARPDAHFFFPFSCASREKMAPAIPAAFAADIAGGPRAVQTPGTLRVPVHCSWSSRLRCRTGARGKRAHFPLGENAPFSSPGGDEIPKP
jgi:hypothetical protein